VKQPKIKDYAVIGNGRSAALVSRFGSIDWLCWPRFDSGSIFAAILDPNAGGHWRIQPQGEADIARRYVENTNVLETCFQTPAGTVSLTDFMPVAAEQEKRSRFWPEHELIRQITCEQGRVRVDVEFAPRPDYARMPVLLKERGPLGVAFEVGANLFLLRAERPVHMRDSGTVVASFELTAGERLSFSLSFAAESPAVLPLLGDVAAEKLELSVNWWRRWVEQSNYRGRYERYVRRSALLLKLLSYAPSGAIIAAPTSSLPESVGADLNWDYRFAWLRDAAFTVRALFGLGYKDDAEAFVNWLLHATRLTRPELRVVYDVFGEQPLREQRLEHLTGYRHSRPVRIGNAASDQLQLDIYGEVIEAVGNFIGKNQLLDRDMGKLLRQCGEYVCAHWREADHGMWEYRDRQRCYTHSRLMCWVALDRLTQLHERGQLCKIEIDKIRAERDQLRRAIETQNWNKNRHAYTQAADSDEVDASALLLAFYQFEAANSERLLQTHARIREALSPKLGLLWRDESSKRRGEGAFAFCSFWEIDFLARSGRIGEAHELFHATLTYANDVGLFAEQIEPDTGDALGNFPQAFTHLGVINAALSLRMAEEGVRSNQQQ
jgi:GH15 family glucan-1,4-alpha-glucosidase